MGAATISNPSGSWKARKHDVSADGRRVVRVSLNGSASYATGGDTVDLSQIGLRNVDEALIVASEAGRGPNQLVSAFSYSGSSVVLDLTAPEAPKLKVYTSFLTEASAASDQSGVTAHFELRGH